MSTNDNGRGDQLSFSDFSDFGFRERFIREARKQNKRERASLKGGKGGQKEDKEIVPAVVEQVSFFGECYIKQVAVDVDSNIWGTIPGTDEPSQEAPNFVPYVPCQGISPF